MPKEKVGQLATLYRQPKPGVLEKGKDGESLTEKPTTFMGGHALNGTTADYARFCAMILGGGELDGVRVLKKETIDLMFQNHLKGSGQKYGLGGAVDGDGGYSWGGPTAPSTGSTARISSTPCSWCRRRATVPRPTPTSAAWSTRRWGSKSQ